MMLMIMPLAADTLGKPSVTEPHPKPILNFIVKGCRAQPFTATHTEHFISRQWQCWRSNWWPMM